MGNHSQRSISQNDKNGEVLTERAYIFMKMLTLWGIQHGTGVTKSKPESWGPGRVSIISSLAPVGLVSECSKRFKTYSVSSSLSSFLDMMRLSSGLVVTVLILSQNGWGPKMTLLMARKLFVSFFTQGYLTLLAYSISKCRNHIWMNYDFTGRCENSIYLLIYFIFLKVLVLSNLYSQHGA